MVEVIDEGTRIPHLTQKATTIDVDVQEELCSARDPLPYMGQQPEFATALASAYNDRLTENRLKLPSRKRCHPPYTTGRSSRCMCSLSK
jgi:hypothetical protein